MSDLLSEAETAEVSAYLDSPDNLAWERRLAAKWAKQRGLPSGFELHQARVRERKRATNTALAAKRRAAELKRTPPWADLWAIKAIYEEARRLTKARGAAYHVDHIIPLQGKLVSGLHVPANLQILTASENSRKRNRYDV